MRASLGSSLQVSPTDDRRFLVRPPPSRQHSSVEIDHEIFSKAILSLPELLLTYSGLLGYIEVDLFSILGPLTILTCYIVLPRKTGWIFY